MTPFLAMDVLERAQELEQNCVNVIHMEVGEPDFNIPSDVKNAVIEAVESGKTHYTHSLGNPELRAEICNLYKREYGVEHSPEGVVVTSGTSPAIFMTLCLLCNAGDEVILFNPGYACYANFVLAAGAKPVEVILSADDGFKINPDKLKKYITDKTKAIFINSPCNPTGALIDSSTMQQIAATGITIISDEIYHGLVYSGRAHSILEYTDNAFVLNGFSKRYAMTGLRLGYLLFPKKLMPQIKILQQNLYICAPSISQYGALAALRGNQDEILKMKETYNQRREYLVERLLKIGFEIPYEPCGAFYVFADASKFCDNSLKFAFEILENAHVGVTPGLDFGSAGEKFLRFSYANSLNNIVEGLNRIEKYLNR